MFVRDQLSGATIFASRADGATGAAGDENSVQPSLSADGQRVAFTSSADNLSTEDDNAALSNVFVRDLATDTTTFVSRATGAAGARS